MTAANQNNNVTPYFSRHNAQKPASTVITEVCFKWSVRYLHAA